MPGDARPRFKIRLGDPIRLNSDQLLTLEFAFTSWTDSCKDLYSINRCCRRRTGHDGEHGSGFDAHRIRWP